jgi:sec-independent protein translocase protein TatA
MLAAPMIYTPGAWELVLIVLVLLLLFGAKKLPELARGSGRALRIFKSETRGLMDDEQSSDTADQPRPLTSGEATPDTPEQQRDSARKSTES